jgi:hypothetical protein
MPRIETSNIVRPVDCGLLRKINVVLLKIIVINLLCTCQFKPKYLSFSKNQTGGFESLILLIFHTSTLLFVQKKTFV